MTTNIHEASMGDHGPYMTILDESNYSGCLINNDLDGAMVTF